MKLSEPRRSTNSTQTVEVTADIVDAPPRPLHRQSRTDWQPRSITVTYTRTRSGADEWSDWRLAVGSAHLSGQKLRKDGSDAAQTYVQGWVDERDPEFGQWVKDQVPDGTAWRP